LISTTGHVFSIIGTLSKTRAQVESLIKSNGGSVASTLTNKVTHLITTTAEYNSSSMKVVQAQGKGIPIVSEHYLDAKMKSATVDLKKYSFNASALPATTTTTSTPAFGGLPRLRDNKVPKKPKPAPVEDDKAMDDEEDEEAPAPSKAPAKSNPKKRTADAAGLDDSDDRPFKRLKSKPSAKAPKVKCWKANDSSQPDFSDQLEVLEHVVMQVRLESYKGFSRVV